MSDVLKRLLCLVLALVVVFSFAGCRKSPVLEQTIYTQDAEVDPENQQTDNDEEHTEENTTLPPRTQQQSASRQNEQTRVSAKPKPTTGNSTNNNTQNNSQTPKPSEAKPSNTDNSNKAQGNTPGVSEDPSSNIPAIDDRSPVNPDAIPENVKNVAAVGPAALFVEMLGGSNRLLASSANFISNGLASSVFSDLANVKGLWEHDGEAAMTDAQFQQLLTTNPEAVFYIADANYGKFGTVQSFSSNQLTQLNQKGIYTVPLSMFNTTNNIKNNVRVMGKVLGNRPDIQGYKNANEMAERYIEWLDDVVKSCNHPFSGPNKWNLDQSESFDFPEKVDSYEDEGQYTILIDGWDDSASTKREQGVAYARTGYSVRNSPASYFLSLGGAANTAVLVTDTDGSIPYLPIVPTYMDLAGLSIKNGRSLKAYEAQDKSKAITGGFGYIGTGSFRKIVVDSARTVNALMNSFNTGNAWAPTEYVMDAEGSGGYGYINDNGRLVSSNIHGSDFEFVINPYGLGPWTEGTPEAPLEALWANQLFNGGLSSHDAFNAITPAIQNFYAEFFEHSLTQQELDYIEAGGP